jgi:hypothetical protein
MEAKKKMMNASALVEENITRALGEVGPSAPMVADSFNDESEDWVASIAAFADAGASAAVVPDTGGDKEFSWKPFVELNRETVEVLGDKVITDLVSDDEEGFGTPPIVVLEKMMPLVARKSHQAMHRCSGVLGLT